MVSKTMLENRFLNRFLKAVIIFYMQKYIVAIAKCYAFLEITFTKI